MRLRKCSLRKMMRDGLVNDQIKRQVLQQLKPFVTLNKTETNGDLKDVVLCLRGLLKAQTLVLGDFSCCF